jgi:glycosyltransferase involved in cell wall biosynthesis
MRLMFVVQRYGPAVAGGAEHVTRQLAERLVAAGHHIEVATSCAESYDDWANAYPPGTADENGVTVHRFATVAPRRATQFGPLMQRAVAAPTGRPRSPVLGEAWATMLGPDLDGFTEHLASTAASFDAVIFSGYLFQTSVSGVPAVAGLAPIIVQPAAHDEAYLRLPIYRRVFELATMIAAFTEEEAELIDRRFRPEGEIRVIGSGVDEPPDGVRSDPSDHIVSVGRIEPGKGTDELVAYYEEFRRRHPDAPDLILVGSNNARIVAPDGVTITGFVDPVEKWSLIATAKVLVQPSYFESFSLTLTEAWRVGVPALVQQRCDVLAGQLARAHGGLTYGSYAEFDAALELLLDDPQLRTTLGANGHEYTRRYEWDHVVDLFVELVADARERQP